MSLIQWAVEDNAAMLKNNSTTAELLQQLIRVGRKDQGSYLSQKLGQPFTRLGEEPVITSSNPLIQCQCLMSKRSEKAELKAGSHTLTVGADREINEIRKLGKSNKLLKEQIESPDGITVQEVMSTSSVIPA